MYLKHDYDPVNYRDWFCEKISRDDAEDLIESRPFPEGRDYGRLDDGTPIVLDPEDEKGINEWYIVDPQTGDILTEGHSELAPMKGVFDRILSILSPGRFSDEPATGKYRDPVYRRWKGYTEINIIRDDDGKTIDVVEEEHTREFHDRVLG